MAALTLLAPTCVSRPTRPRRLLNAGRACTLYLPLIRSNPIMATTAKTRSVTAHVPVQLAEKVDLMAERLERSKNWIVKQALAAWIDQEEERSRLTRESLADVDAGRVIDHQAVQAWAESLSTDTPLPVPR